MKESKVIYNEKDQQYYLPAYTGIKHDSTLIKSQDSWDGQVKKSNISMFIICKNQSSFFKTG